MQIAEDTQSIVGHMIMQWLHASRGDFALPLDPAASKQT
jgi:hypothetical protein